MKKMEGKVVLITGGARGIGYGVAKAFAEEGANIVITGRTASTLVEARENLEADYGIEALFVVADGGRGGREKCCKASGGALRSSGLSGK